MVAARLGAQPPEDIDAGGQVTSNRIQWITGVSLLAVYMLTMAPGVTFWDAGEFISAAHVFGIPHPPGTPLFVAMGRVWTLALAPVLGVARASNLLSASCTAAAGGLAARMFADDLSVDATRKWFATTAAAVAGLGTSVWANATETEVYAASLLLVMAMLYAARQAAATGAERERWFLLTVFLMALAPALHLSALVGAPAAIVLATRMDDSSREPGRALILLSATVATTAVGTMSLSLFVPGAGLFVIAAMVRIRERRSPMTVLAAAGLCMLAWSALLILLVRARHDPSLNQGNPATFTAFADVVARRQYDLAPLWPRRAPVWLQLVNVLQYADWQFGMGLGRGIFTTPWRVLVMCLYAVLGVGGWRALRRDAPRLAWPLLTLLACGSLGVCVYLNLKAGASIGYGIVPGGGHEARERDYFFVLAFWAWGLLAGYGAVAAARLRRWSPAWGALSVALPLLANWGVNDRAHGAEATAPRDVAHALLESAPPHAMLFLAGDNDTYPVWYLQQVERYRPDVTVVTLPLLPADWYFAQVSSRSGLPVHTDTTVPHAEFLHEQRAAILAAAARAAGRPVSATTQVTSHLRAFLGAGWRLRGAVYVASGPPRQDDVPPSIPPGTTAPVPVVSNGAGRRFRLPDDVSDFMLGSLQCARLGSLRAEKSLARDSLETRCNLR